MFWAKLIKHTYPISASRYQKSWEIFLEVMLIGRGESLLKNSQNKFLNSEQNFLNKFCLPLSCWKGSVYHHQKPLYWWANKISDRKLSPEKSLWLYKNGAIIWNVLINQTKYWPWSWLKNEDDGVLSKYLGVFARVNVCTRYILDKISPLS